MLSLAEAHEVGLWPKEESVVELSCSNPISELQEELLSEGHPLEVLKTSASAPSIPEEALGSADLQEPLLQQVYRECDAAQGGAMDRFSWETLCVIACKMERQWRIFSVMNCLQMSITSDWD